MESALADPARFERTPHISIDARLAQRIAVRNPGAEPGCGGINLAKGEPGKHALLLLRALARRLSPAIRRMLEMKGFCKETTMTNAQLINWFQAVEMKIRPKAFVLPPTTPKKSRNMSLFFLVGIFFL
jgi:hypothetical protein